MARSKAALLLSSFKMRTLSALSSSKTQVGSSPTIPSCSSLASRTESRKVLVVPDGNLSSLSRKSEAAAFFGLTSSEGRLRVVPVGETGIQA